MCIYIYIIRIHCFCLYVYTSTNIIQNGFRWDCLTGRAKTLQLAIFNHWILRVSHGFPYSFLFSQSHYDIVKL